MRRSSFFDDFVNLRQQLDQLTGEVAGQVGQPRVVQIGDRRGRETLAHRHSLSSVHPAVHVVVAAQGHRARRELRRAEPGAGVAHPAGRPMAVIADTIDLTCA